VLKDDQFPGAICKMGTPVKAVLVFSSGRVIFTGTNERMKI
jgi:TATA-box binding protein (TBP) (component of TFIID and TFIIIB)